MDDKFINREERDTRAITDREITAKWMNVSTSQRGNKRRGRKRWARFRLRMREVYERGGYSGGGEKWRNYLSPRGGALNTCHYRKYAPRGSWLSSGATADAHFSAHFRDREREERLVSSGSFSRRRHFQREIAFCRHAYTRIYIYFGTLLIGSAGLAHPDCLIMLFWAVFSW